MADQIDLGCYELARTDLDRDITEISDDQIVLPDLYLESAKISRALGDWQRWVTLELRIEVRP